MKTIKPCTALAYPTRYTQELFPSLCAELGHLETLMGATPRTDESGYRMTVASLEDLLADHYEALALFLAHPTRRLSEVLVTAVTEAENALGWLIEHPLAPPTGSPSDLSDVAICERVRSGIAEWRFLIDLERVFCDLDERPVDTVH